MSTLFTRIIDGELPGRFVWRDTVAVSFLTIAPLQPGHALVVPRVEVDNWLDLDDATITHLVGVARTIGRAQQAAFDCPRIGLVIAGLEVPHVHLHSIPIRSESDLAFANADPSPDPTALDEAAEAIRAALRTMGVAEAADRR
ncbi:MAG: HIT family protein [Actinobacteria bacterium]|nr:HIT family protein [Actinomycetota bacterium]